MGQEPTPMTTDPDTQARRDAAHLEAEAVRTDDPAEIRRDIADTRGEMEGTLEAINDRVNPQRVYERRTARARTRWQSLKGSVMGSDDSSSSGSTPSGSSSLSDRTPDVDVSGRARQAQQAVSDAPDAAKRKTKGNPLAAGTIAFGIGALIGSLLPETEAEKQAAREADRHIDLGSTQQRLTERAQQVGDEVKSSAQDSEQELKGQAQSATQDVKSDAQQEGERVKQDAQQAKDRAQRDT
ncbi:DUF3618 domain-containing protein [soil metagenome]